MIAAILLAAGLSSRTKRFHKLLLPYKGKKLLDHAITAITRSAITYLIIVTGKQQRKIRKIIPKKDMIKVVYNPKYRSGMASSIKVGLQYLPKEVTHFFIALADMPKVNKNHYNKIISAIKKNPKLPVVPYVDGQAANPVLFPKHFIRKLQLLEGDLGARMLLRRSKHTKLAFRQSALLTDLDSLADFKTKRPSLQNR